MTQTPREQLVEKILLLTKDSHHDLFNRPVPALTTLLYKVCDCDSKKFEEACRLVELFILKALEEHT